MMSMDKVTTVANATAYGTAYGSSGYWFYKLTTAMTPDQWAVVGVLGSLAFAGLTYITNVVIKVWAIKRGYRLPKED
ncbi:phage holin [Pantoea vagans]|nr:MULTISPECIES: phage holin [Pantoea]MDE8559080.1 phage holin [Pantoea vagans]HCR5063829.1 peptidoglycan-binding protein LysM [Enterobacter asburiae]